MITDVKGRVNQASPDVLSDGDQEYLRLTKLGQLFTADWHQRLVLAGRAYSLDFGTVAATAYTALTGNAAPDLDQPEIVIGVDSGWLIPMEIDIAVSVDDQDAYDDRTDMMFIIDRSQAEAAGATATVETPLNLLDGGAAFSGRCWSIVTSNITAPVVSDVLTYANWTAIQLAAEVGGTVPVNKRHEKKFTIPRLIAGPCQIVGYVTGTNTPTFIGHITFAHIPASWATVP